MSQYLSEISDSLVRVLDAAVRLTDYRLFGYAANAQFWANEVDHSLQVLRGFPARQKCFDDALKTLVREHREKTGYSRPTQLFYGEAYEPAQLAEQRRKVAVLETAIINAAKPFFRKLW